MTSPKAIKGHKSWLQGHGQLFGVFAMLSVSFFGCRFKRHRRSCTFFTQIADVCSTRTETAKKHSFRVICRCYAVLYAVVFDLFGCRLWAQSLAFAACCYSPGLALALLRGWTIRAHALCTARIAVLSQLQKHARQPLVFMYGVSCLFEPRFDCQRLLVLLQSGPLCTATLWCRSGCGRAAPAPACCSCDSRDLRPS